MLNGLYFPCSLLIQPHLLAPPSPPHTSFQFLSVYSSHGNRCSFVCEIDSIECLLFTFPPPPPPLSPLTVFPLKMASANLAVRLSLPFSLACSLIKSDDALFLPDGLDDFSKYRRWTSSSYGL